MQGESNEVVAANATYTCRFKAWMDDLNRRFASATGGTTASSLHFGFVQIGELLVISLAQQPSWL
eukprot:COSAG01_NODE_2141_length_8319_cov_4.012406_12_plen_65_part_00